MTAERLGEAVLVTAMKKVSNRHRKASRRQEVIAWKEQKMKECHGYLMTMCIRSVIKLLCPISQVDF